MVKWFSMLFGGQRNALVETIEVFRPNAENEAQRSANTTENAIQQYSNEFGRPGFINQLADGMNRMGRPFITYGVIGLFVSAMYNPVWFAARMQGLVLVPEPLWIIFGAIVSFFFGSRELGKFRMAKEAARITAAVPQVLENIRSLNALTPGVADTNEEISLSDNPAVDDWKKGG